MAEHGSAVIKEWMRDLVELARSGREFDTSGGADPGRAYAYLEYHLSDEEHSLLLFRVEEEDGRPLVRAYRVHGAAADVSRKVDDLTHAP